MANKKFLYFLTDAQNKVYTLNNGVVSKSNNLVPLPNNPSGWREQSIKFARNNTYSGLVPTFSVPLKFVKTSAKILRHLLYNNGQEEVVYLVVLRFNYFIGEYEGYYKGEIDLSKVEDSKDYFETSVTEFGFYKFLKAYENTDYDIPFEGDGVIDIEMDGISLQKTKKYTFGDGGGGFGFLSSSIQTFSLNCLYVTEEGTGFNLIDGDSPVKDLSGWSPSDSSRAILRNIGDESVICNIKGSLKAFALGLNPGTFRVFLQKNDGTEIDLVTITIPISPTTTNIFNFDANFVLNSGQHITPLCQVPGTNFIGSVSIYSLDNNDLFSIKYLSKFKKTYIKAIKPLPFGQQLLNKMSSNTDYKLQSDVLTNSRIVFTTGDQIRGISASKAKAKFKDFFNAMHVNLVVGLKVDENSKIVTLPSKKTFYNSSLIYDLGEVSDCIFEVDENFLYSNIKVGYPNKDYDDINGKDEFNNTHNYTTPTKRSTKTLDLTNNWRADCYGVEFQRINLAGKTTTDSSSDNNIFLLDVIPKVGKLYNGIAVESSYQGGGLNIPYKNVEGFGFITNTNNSQFTYTKNAKNLTISGLIKANTSITGQYLFSILVNNNVEYRVTNNSNITTTFTFTKLFNTNDILIFNITGLGALSSISIIDATFGIEGMELYKLNRPEYTSITGVISPTSIFNVELSPKRILLAHQDFIKSTQWNLGNKKISFQTTEKNSKLSTTISGVSVIENSDLTIGDLTGEYFLPIKAKFKAQVPSSLLSILKTNSFGVFEFTYLGNKYNGYLIECSQKPSGNEAQQWTILLSNNNNLINLIHG